MAKRRRKIKLRYKKERVLFSDVLPYEMPFIVSNRYLYRFLVKNKIGVENGKIVWRNDIEKGAKHILELLVNIKINAKTSLELKEISECTIPFTYSIQHKPTKYRQLSIIHPLNQILVVNFYEKYKNAILYFTNQSNFSIRHPNDVACYFYYKDRLHQTLLGRKSDKLEMFFSEYENLRTYFSYVDYTNIYKFYEDYKYQRAEKKFTHLLKFDIQGCFDNIYTHSLAWATSGGKDIYKRFFKGESYDGFGDNFDKLMQGMNYAETNGIVIGPEFSRIFAEIILQNIDVRAERRLKAEKGFLNNIHYECFRYVDDYFFFYDDDEVKDSALRIFAELLGEYKLTISSEKTKEIPRPFITDITRAKILIDELLSESLAYQYRGETLDLERDELDAPEIDWDKADVTIEQLEKAMGDDGYFKLRPELFNSEFKAILKATNLVSKDVMNYTLACVGTKLEQALKRFDRPYKILSRAESDPILMEHQKDIRKLLDKKAKQVSLYLCSVLDVVFFLYSDCKRVNTTIKAINILNIIILYMDNHYEIRKKEIMRFKNSIREVVFKKIQDEVSLVFQTSKYSEYTQIETLYFLIVLRQMRSKYQISPEALMRYLGIEADDKGRLKPFPTVNYLTSVVLIYYFGNNGRFSDLKHCLLDRINSQVESVPEDLRVKTSELVLLTLDMIACPYFRCQDLNTICKLMGIGNGPRDAMFKYLRHGKYMFTKWTGVNITKELNAKISQEVYA